MEGDAPRPRAGRLSLGVIAVFVASCAAGAPPNGSQSPTSSAVVVATPSPASTTITPTASPSPTATATLSPSASRPPTGAPTSAPTSPAAVDYCAVRDVLTPNREYVDHARTFLDWTYALPQTYVPPDLVNAVSGEPFRPPRAVEAVGAAEVLARRGDPSYSTLLTDAPGAAIRGLAYDDLTAMRRAAAGAGHRLVILSAYRSFALQQQTFDYWVSVGGYDQALRTSARAGHSEHQLGTVIDFGDGSAAPWEYADWATTDTGRWLAQHAADHGFVMSYQKGQTALTCYDYEPWHYRWVGKETAMRITSAAVPLRVYQAGLR